MSRARGGVDVTVDGKIVGTPGEEKRMVMGLAVRGGRPAEVGGRAGEKRGDPDPGEGNAAADDRRARRPDLPGGVEQRRPGAVHRPGRRHDRARGCGLGRLGERALSRRQPPL